MVPQADVVVLVTIVVGVLDPLLIPVDAPRRPRTRRDTLVAQVHKNRGLAELIADHLEVWG